MSVQKFYVYIINNKNYHSNHSDHSNDSRKNSRKKQTNTKKNNKNNQNVPQIPQGRICKPVQRPVTSQKEVMSHKGESIVTSQKINEDYLSTSPTNTIDANKNNAAQV